MSVFLLSARNLRGIRFLIGMIGPLILISVQDSLAQTIRYVTTTGTQTNPATATTWAIATADLQGAINASNAGDQVWVANGTYKPGGQTNTDRTISFSLKNGVSLFGGFAGTETRLNQRPAIDPVANSHSGSTLSGDLNKPGDINDNSSRVILNAPGLTNTAVLDGFVITAGQNGGMVNTSGAGQVCSPLIRYCTFQANTGETGAGISNNSNYGGNTNPSLINCAFLANVTVRDGGAIYNYAYGGGSVSSPNLNNCLFLNNTATTSANGTGAAISNYAYGDGSVSSPSLNNCTFRENNASRNGGAIANYSYGGGSVSSPSLSNCLFLNNTAKLSGGALYNRQYGGQSSPTLTNCTFLNNTASYSGGAITNTSEGTAQGQSSPRLTNCTFQGNKAGYRGGAIDNFANAGKTNPLVVNCSFQGNEARYEGSVIFNSGGGGSASDYTILTNCVVFGNRKDDAFVNVDGGIITATYSLFDDSDGVNITGPGNLTTTNTPFAAGTDVALAPGSRAINAGNPASTTVASPPYSGVALPPTDVVGNPRIDRGRIDMGAAEFQSAVPKLLVSASPNPVCNGTPVRFTVTVENVTGAYNYTLTNGTGTPIQGVAPGSPFSLSLTAGGTGPQTYTVSVADGGATTKATLTLTVNPLSPDLQPLVDLYNATNGPRWARKTNWLTGCTPCGWQGVSCDGNGRVTGLSLAGNNLSGTLPASFTVLSSLQTLDLNTNYLTGTFPASLTVLSSLKLLNLGNNALTGGIPSGIGSLTILENLNLFGNQLTGTLPASLGQLAQLQQLNLQGNRLTGPLPASLAGLAQLQYLSLASNQLSGCFPSNFTALCGRTQLNFSNNPDLPGGGDFGAFCSPDGTGSELVVNQGPRSGTACVGSAYSFSVVARGAGSYQWYKEGQRLAEAGPVLRLSSITAADAGTYQVYINYGCRSGAVQSDYVTLTVPQPGTGGCEAANTAPVATANASQTATVGRAFSYTVNAFSDAQTPNRLTYSASIDPVNGLSFDATTRILAGIPSQPDPVSVTITATDPGGLSASTSFSISVGPRMVSSTPLQVTLTASPQTLLTSGSTVLQATASGGTLGAPPSGYTYTFSGPGDFAASQPEQVTVTNLPVGVQTFTVVVTDAATPTRQTTSATVSVTVSEANTAPTVANIIPSQSATVGQDYRYVIPAATFTDAQTPNSLSLSIAGLPQGVSFTAPAILSGTPLLSGVSSVTVTATDPGGLSAITRFSITVQAAPVVVTPLALTLTASPTALLTTGTTTLLATASGGTPGTPDRSYRYNFSGPGTIVPSNNTAQVSSLPVGVQTFTVVVSDATTPTNQSITKTVSVTVSAPATNTALRVLHLDADNNLANNAIKPTLQVENTGTAPLSYGQLTMRYWLTVEQFAPLTNLAVYYAQLGTAKVKLTYVALDKPRQGASGYVEYSFDGSAGSLAAGANSGLIQTGIAKQDYTAFDEADDYSYANTRNLTANSRVTAYLDGQLVWGTEPAEVAVQRTVKAYTENKSGNSTNSISTFLQVRNEGNVAVSYGDLKVRYYFTSEGSQSLNFYLDYAVLGNQKVKGQFGRLNPPLANADAYLELSFDESLGMLNPGSSTGSIQYRLAKQDWSNFTQSNDYSYQNGTQPMAENNRVVVYLAGQRVYGTEPGEGARLGIAGNDVPWRILVLGNPVVGTELRFEVVGVEGQPLRMQLADLSGQVISERAVERARALEYQSLPIVHQKAGILLLRVSTPSQSQTVKVLTVN